MEQNWVHFCRHAWASQVPEAKSSSTRQWESKQALGHLPFPLHSTDWWPCLLCSILTNSNVLLDQVHILSSPFASQLDLNLVPFEGSYLQIREFLTVHPPTHFPYHQNSQPPLPQMTKPTSLDSKFHDTNICSDSGPNGSRLLGKGLTTARWEGFPLHLTQAMPHCILVSAGGRRDFSMDSRS